MAKLFGKFGAHIKNKIEKIKEDNKLNKIEQINCILKGIPQKIQDLELIKEELGGVTEKFSDALEHKYKYELVEIESIRTKIKLYANKGLEEADDLFKDIDVCKKQKILELSNDNQDLIEYAKNFLNYFNAVVHRNYANYYIIETESIGEIAKELILALEYIEKTLGTESPNSEYDIFLHEDILNNLKGYYDKVNDIDNSVKISAKLKTIKTVINKLEKELEEEEERERETKAKLEKVLEEQEEKEREARVKSFIKSDEFKKIVKSDDKNRKNSKGNTNNEDNLQEFDNEVDKKKVITTSKGLKVQSMGEKYIAEFLDAHFISYDYDKQITLRGIEKMNGHDTSWCRPDFYLTEFNLIIEYWGMKGDKDYDVNMDKKTRLYKEANQRFISIIPQDIPDLKSMLITKLKRLGVIID
ncbi:MAG: hypothetical protein V1859_11380 [archaeon]